MSDSKRKVGWLDLTGHSEVTVLPKKVFNEYVSYYTTAGVNLRSGPSTSYGKVQLVDRGTKVKAAAKEGNWTFVSVGSKFGWISSDYLSTKPPVEVTSGSLSRT
ncbi:MAG: SH3 domain-containing protein [Oscillospiraceae bacterium]